LVAQEISGTLCAHGGTDARWQDCDEPVILSEISSVARDPFSNNSSQAHAFRPPIDKR
jgi:hypothetical protein